MLEINNGENHDVISSDVTSTFRCNGTVKNIMENVICMKGKTEKKYAVFFLAARHMRLGWVVGGGVGLANEMGGMGEEGETSGIICEHSRKPLTMPKALCVLPLASLFTY